jgi:hypothetical protein
LFFDGSQVRDDVNRAWEIGDYWQWVITNGRGSYWNCNAHKEDYKYCGMLTRERIRQIESKALRKLRYPSRAESLRDFIEIPKQKKQEEQEENEES